MNVVWGLQKVVRVISMECIDVCLLDEAGISEPALACQRSEKSVSSG